MKQKIMVIASLLFVSAPGLALTVQIFTDRLHPVAVAQVDRNTAVYYYNLNQYKNIVNGINSEINTNNISIASAQARKLIRQYRQQLKHTIAGIQYVHKYKISEVPTIVFNNGEYLIKGQTNLATAIQEYQEWQKVHRK